MHQFIGTTPYEKKGIVIGILMSMLSLGKWGNRVITLTSDLGTTYHTSINLGSMKNHFRIIPAYALYSSKMMGGLLHWHAVPGVMNPARYKARGQLISNNYYYYQSWTGLLPLHFEDLAHHCTMTRPENVIRHMVSKCTVQWWKDLKGIGRSPVNNNYYYYY